MELNNIQLNILNQIFLTDRLCIFSERQMGVTTALMSFASSEAIFESKTTLVMTNHNQTEYWHRFVKTNLPEDFYQQNSKQFHIRFHNGGSIFLTTVKSEAFRGLSYDHVIIDDLRIRNNEEILYTIHSILRNGSKLIVRLSDYEENGDFLIDDLFQTYIVNEESKSYKGKNKNFIKWKK